MVLTKWFKQRTQWCLNYIKGNPPRSCRLTHLKIFFFENIYFHVANVFSVSKLICGALIYPLSIWQLGIYLERICWTGKSVTNDFPWSTYIIQVFNELQTDKILKVPQDRVLCPTPVDNNKKQVFERITRPDLSGGSLSLGCLSYKM